MKKNIILFLFAFMGMSTLTAFAQGTMMNPDSAYGDFVEITPADSLFITPADEDFWVVTTAPSDYDSDGDLDIAVFGYYVVYNVSAVDKLILMRNEGPAGQEEWHFTYFELPLGTMTAGASDMAWGDMDADGDLDLAVGSDDNTVIYRNDTGTLQLTDIDLPGYWEENSQAEFDLRSITWADFDNDGDFDLLLPSVYDYSTFSFHTALMRNDGPDGTGGWIFSEMDTVFTPTMHAQSTWADYDGDEDLDLLLINVAPLYDESFIRRYRNDGNGIFVGEDILGTLSVEHGEGQWGDYDGDGDLDIMVAGNIKEVNGSYTPLALRIYRNDNESYIPVEVIENPYSEGWFDFTAATWADYDSDGDMDILLAGNYNSGTEIEGRARIYMNNNGVFTDSGNELPSPRAAGDRGGTFSWLDLDGDGDLDYFIAGQYFVPNGNGLVEAQMHLYRNDSPGQNFAPVTPTGLTVTQLTDSSVVLSWDPGIDDHTPADALTYDLKVFHEYEPVAIPKHTPEPGNLSAITEWLLTGLQTGNYTWTISTVDAAYIGSPVATGEFSIFPVSSENLDPEQNSGYNLGQNFPNPASQQTMITYSIPSEELVSLNIYSIRGQLVAGLVHEKKPAGEHSITFDASGLSSGVYYYRLQTGTFSLTKKMVK